MKHIRPADVADLERIAEIEVFNYRLNFYPIFRNDEYYFAELCVSALMKEMRDALDQLWVYDDGAVKGFIRIEGREISKLFVEPVLHGMRIGAELLAFAINEKDACWLWALEKNTRAIAFYERHGFYRSQERKLEEGTDEYLVRMKREA